MVYGWGLNKNGQLGLKEENGVVETPKLIDTVLDYNFKKVNCGHKHTMLIEENGNLLAFGNNKWGQIGIKSQEDMRTPINVF